MNILKEYESEEFLKKEGFDIAKREIVENLDNAIKVSNKLGYPVVLKNPNLLHKSESGGVKTNVYESVMEKKFKELKAEKVLVQEQVEGEEFLVGIKKDDIFGHVILFGIGGIYTEMLNDTSMRVFPIKKEDAEEMLEEIKFNKIFDYRNKKVNKKLIIEDLLRLNKLIKKHPNIKELDINPLFVNEKKSIVTDARIIFE